MNTSTKFKLKTISFRTAMLLKEKGFPQDLFNTGWFNEFGHENGRTDLNEDQEHICVRGLFQTKEEQANNVNGVYIRPTQELVVKWLREEHGVIIYYELFHFHGYHYKFKVMKTELNDFETIEEEFEVGLETTIYYALSYIKTK